MVRVIWQDGHLDEAPTFRDLEDHLLRDAWNPSDRWAFRREMRRRAWRWSRTRVPILTTAAQFFRNLERAGMLRVEEDVR